MEVSGGARQAEPHRDRGGTPKKSRAFSRGVAGFRTGSPPARGARLLPETRLSLVSSVSRPSRKGRDALEVRCLGAPPACPWKRTQEHLVADSARDPCTVEKTVVEGRPHYRAGRPRVGGMCHRRPTHFFFFFFLFFFFFVFFLLVFLYFFCFGPGGRVRAGDHDGPAFT